MNGGAEIRRKRIEKGLTQAQLAELLGCDVSTISRYERDERTPSISTAEVMARELNSTIPEILGVPATNGIGPAGFSDDMVPYATASGDRLAALTGPNRSLWIIDNDVLDNIGMRRGAIAVVDDSQKARDELKPLQAVQVAYHSKSSPGKAVRLLRQFVPPGLIITNSSHGNLPSLDLNKDDAQIVGVIDSVHLQMRLGH
ncbi:MAG: multiprotein-bridging factor 1 family protein [Hyphomicrobium sp.]